MAKVKVLEIDEKIEKALKNICDSALESKGDEIMGTIDEISNAIQEQNEEDKCS
ncbi:MAG: hypothetical protein ACRDAI_00540 [Candidatus Rhabdochlamydia sp.]